MTELAEFDERQKHGELPPIVESYGLAGIRVHERLWSDPILLLPSGVKAWKHSNPLKANDFEFLDELATNKNLLEDSLEDFLLIVGTGAKAVFLEQKLEKTLQKRAVPFEVMATPAACRCYNLLLAEGRVVIAALLPLEWNG